MQLVTYYLFRFVIFVFKFVPFWLLYMKSDFVAFVLYHIIGYRKQVTLQNLRNSFPKKNEKEIRKIAKASYKNLSDILLESIKSYGTNVRKLIPRYVVENPEILDKAFADNQNIMALMSHYCNWEWMTAGGLQLKHQLVSLFHEIKNPYLNKYILSSRTKYGALLVSTKNARNLFAQDMDKPGFFIFIADQYTTNKKHTRWVHFLNQDTACPHGPETFTRLYKLPVYYFHVYRKKRGYYAIKIIDLNGSFDSEKEGDLTRIYMRTLENIIKEEPANWLWTHKRWKRKRKPNEPIYK